MFLSDSPSEMMNFKKKKLGKLVKPFVIYQAFCIQLWRHTIASRNFTGQSTLTDNEDI